MQRMLKMNVSGDLVVRSHNFLSDGNQRVAMDGTLLDEYSLTVSVLRPILFLILISHINKDIHYDTRVATQISSIEDYYS